MAIDLPTSLVEMAHRWWSRLRPPRRFGVYSCPEYRLPLTGSVSPTVFDARRSDFALWYLLDRGLLKEADIRRPEPISYGQLLLVHTPEYLDSLSQARKLAEIFSVDPCDVPVDQLLHALRLACGGTLGAAREALRGAKPTLNLLGGFHHAGPGRGGGYCAVNDMAVAVKVLRSEGFAGQVAILNLDAHPPDGTRECLAADPRVWIGSISGTSWGPLAGVDETVLPPRAPDTLYLVALRELLRRMPRAELTFVLAGADVLADDPLGQLGLSIRGARRRDLKVIEACEGRATVWLPAGGYRDDAWKVLAGTALVLAGRGDDGIPGDFDPLSSHFATISQSLDPDALSGGNLFSEEDLGEALRLTGTKPQHRFLGFYTLEGLELALERYGVFAHLARLGYTQPRLVLEPGADDERFEVFARADGVEHLLIDLMASRKAIAGETYLFANWLSLRNPRASFSHRRPRLPGQEVPGLGYGE